MARYSIWPNHSTGVVLLHIDLLFVNQWLFFGSCRCRSAHFLITQINSESFFYCSLQLLLHRSHRLSGWPDHQFTFFSAAVFFRFCCWWGEKKIFFAKGLFHSRVPNIQFAPKLSPIRLHYWFTQESSEVGVDGVKGRLNHVRERKKVSLRLSEERKEGKRSISRPCLLSPQHNNSKVDNFSISFPQWQPPPYPVDSSHQ